MSNKKFHDHNINKNNCQQKHFLVISYKQQQQPTAAATLAAAAIAPKSSCYSNNDRRNGRRRNGKSNGSICWLLCCLLVQLIYATQCIPQSEMIYHKVAAGAAAGVVVPSVDITDAVSSKADVTGSSLETLQENVPRISRRSTTFSMLDKEVVDRLIKQWAPVVWLAPEEKFMPLGVEEFLANVHPESKDKSFTPGMPVGDTSEKSFLVTNTEIDKLLENETTFIYGRNPNIAPVPIYAVVTLCHQEQTQPPLQQIHSIQQPVQQSMSSKQQPPFQSNYSPQPMPILQHGFLPTSIEITKPTRGPYIPITLGPQDQVNNTIRRSSRLYPMFQRVKRNVTPPNTPPIPPYDLVMGESIQNVAAPAPAGGGMIRSQTEPIEIEDEMPEKVNNFIANLADNVKFSIPYNEQENLLEMENNNQQFQGVSYNEGTPVPSFHVTYWMFYPYSQGKNMCTLKLGPFGRIPFPAVYGYCLGRKKDIGSHIGDWEHMTLYFTGAAEPEAMYVSAHDAGAYYTYNRLTGSFEFKRQETRKGILQRPNFPKTVTTFNDHPVLFAAKGSHGLWTAPGKHRFVKVARLYDINGFGTPWNTWKHVDITYENLKSYGRSFAHNWLSFKGKWGNPKSKCHPLRRIGLNFCEFTDGPTGIPLKEPHFECGATYRR